MEAALITELVESADIRTNSSRQDDTAKAVSKYLARRHPGTLLAIALDRAMAGNCNGSAGVRRKTLANGDELLPKAKEPRVITEQVQ